MNFSYLIFYFFVYSQACRLAKNCIECTTNRCKFLIANNGESRCSFLSQTRIGLSLVSTEITNSKYCPKFITDPLNTTIPTTKRPKRKIPANVPSIRPSQLPTMKVFQSTTSTTTTDRINAEKESADTITPFSANKTHMDIAIKIPQNYTIHKNSIWVISTIILFAILILSTMIILILIKFKKIRVQSNFRQNRRNIRQEVYGLDQFGFM